MKHIASVMQILIEQVLDADHNRIFLATESYCPTLLKYCWSVACKRGIKYKLFILTYLGGFVIGSIRQKHQAPFQQNKRFVANKINELRK